MRFDIILPCFNEEQYLEKTLESIANQIHKNWKLWFVDDGSTDKSLSMADSFRIRFPEKVSLFTGSNQGISYVCNFVKNLILQDKISEENDLINFDIIKFADMYIDNLEHSDKLKVIMKQKIVDLYNKVTKGEE